MSFFLNRQAPIEAFRAACSFASLDCAVAVCRCNECLQESTCPSYFYELDLQIQGQKQLSDCLTEFLREESLTGSNQVRETALTGIKWYSGVNAVRLEPRRGEML